MGRQLELELKTWGGRRAGAGRKPKGERAGVSHRTRPKVTAHTPTHVTLRVVAGLPNLRGGRMSVALREALGRGARGFGMSMAHYSIQANHLHLLVEASSAAALAKGMKGLCVRMARAVNRVLGRKGKVFSDRYHAHVLKTPREVRHALVYVLNNFRKHDAAKPGDRFDARSSALAFDGWKGGVELASNDVSERVVAKPRGWLLAVGWRRHGLIDPLESPRCQPGKKTPAGTGQTASKERRRR